MKNKLLTLASMLAVFNANAVEIGPTGSGIELSGFIDIAGQKQGADSETSFVGQVEVNLDFSSGPVSASVDLDFTESQGLSDGNGNGFVEDDDTTGGNLEEAVVTYDLGNGLSVSAGKMLSYMGFEAYDPTNMYQYSYAYDIGFQTGYEGAQLIYDAYDVGVSVDYGTDDFSIGVWSSMEADAGYELALAYTGVENFTAKAIFSDFSAPTSEAYEKSTFWVSYQMDKLLLAAEVAENDQADTGSDIDGYLFMANYAMTDAAAITLRYSGIEITGHSDEIVEYEGTKFTISPSYVFNDNFSGLVEYSSYDTDIATGALVEPEELLAVEVIYTF